MTRFTARLNRRSKLNGDTPLGGIPVRQSPFSLAGVATLLVTVSAVQLFGFGTAWGYASLLAGVGLGLLSSRALGRDLFIIAAGLGIVSSISVAADISWPNFFLMGFVLAAAVVVPFLLSRFVFQDRAIVFPSRPGHPWSEFEWLWLGCVIVLAWLILPRYFIHSGAYANWPSVSTPSEIGRLFVGVNAVGIWDELFFICTIFALLNRHFHFWVANLFTAAIFVSFLWELGYRSWGPYITIPFALVQAVIFTRTKSLPYTIAVHLLFDFVVFLSIVHAHHRHWLPIFWY